MKKIFIILTAALCCFATTTGCSKKSAESTMKVYSFSGENEQLKISNGVIVLGADKEVFYGGILEEKQVLEDITSFSMGYYIDTGSEKYTLLDNRVEDMTGEMISIQANTGKVSGEDVIPEKAVSRLENNLFFELETKAIDGEKNVYQVKLSLTEITGNS